jgi:hypothetical protein
VVVAIAQMLPETQRMLEASLTPTEGIFFLKKQTDFFQNGVEKT